MIIAMVVGILGVTPVSVLAVGQGDFVLTISIEETTVRQGENFRVNVELKNNSGDDLEITHHFLFWPIIHDWHLFDDWGVEIASEYQSKLFEAGSVLKNIGVWGNEEEAWIFGQTLEPGTHELRFRAEFYLNWEQANQQRIEVWSNLITLTVTNGFDVPNTGVPGITGAIMSIFAFFAIPTALWGGFILRRKLIKS